MEEQHLEKKPGPTEPELLYHYTTQKGLLGILKDKCIWATHIRYLNDTSEGNIVPRVVFEEFSSRYNASSLFQALGMAPEAPPRVVEPVDEDALGQGTTMASWVTSSASWVRPTIW